MASGEIASTTAKNGSCERAGKLTAVHVNVGDSVETKDLVAEIL
jgi:pyruvate/2-oxoglutarate dehydrogenase complex dihydrolipoamide acyltransferase (E2) component